MSYKYTGGELLDKKLLEHQEKEIRLVNDIIFQSYLHGADAGGGYDSNEEALVSAINSWLEHKNLHYTYAIDTQATVKPSPYSNMCYQVPQIVHKELLNTVEEKSDEIQYPISVRFQNAGGHLTDPSATTYQVVAEFHNEVAKKALYWIESENNAPFLDVLGNLMSIQKHEHVGQSLYLDAKHMMKMIYTGGYRWYLECQHQSSQDVDTYNFSHAFISDSYTRLKLYLKQREESDI